MPNTTTTFERAAIIVSLQPTSNDRGGSVESVSELEHLLAGLGYRVVATMAQRRPDPRVSSVLGRGKLDELRGILAEHEPEGDVVVVFDTQLNPGQQHHLFQELAVEVIDRTQVILRIFEQRARTHSAKLEIELARLRYELPRVRDEAVGQKQAGGGGRGAKGHTAVALRKQQLRKRLAELESELEVAGDLQQTRRARQRQSARVALVGYTNAGKSTWMHALTGADVLVQDKLFVTLDTTVRTLHPPVVPPISIADTIGFLRNLPNELLASFRSTLAEALDAELLLLVLDGSQPLWPTHLATTNDVLQHVGADHTPRLVLVNKRDRMTPSEHRLITESLPGSLCVSAHALEDVERVREAIVSHFAKGLIRSEFTLPFASSALRAEIWRDARVLEERCDELGIHLTVLAEGSRLGAWRLRLNGARGGGD